MGRSDRRLGARRGAAGQARTTAAGQFSCADMKLSAAQVLGREDEDEVLTDHGPPPPAPLFARPSQSPQPPPPSSPPQPSPPKPPTCSCCRQQRHPDHRFSRSGMGVKGFWLAPISPKARTLTPSLLRVNGLINTGLFGASPTPPHAFSDQLS